MEIVYLFRQIGTNYVKIGMTASTSCEERFNSFKTYSPNGGEIVGIIRTNNALNLERELHELYSHKRLNGEFFLLDQDECDLILSSYRHDATERLINIIRELESSGRYNLIESTLKFVERRINDDSNTVLIEDSYIKLIDLINKEFEANDFEHLTSTQVSDYLNDTFEIDTNPVQIGFILSKWFKKSRKRFGKSVKTVYKLNFKSK